MKFFGKPLGLLLASLALTSCGGGGGDGGGAFSPPQNSSISLSATTTTLPVNVWGYQPTQYGNPTQAEVTMTWRNPDGSLVSGQDLHASIAPTNVAVLSCLVDGDACSDGNALFGSTVIKGTNGQATVFVNAFTTAGTATFTVSGVDPNTQRTVSASMTFKVTSGVGPQPASIQLSANPGSVYLPDSGAAVASTITAHVLDGAGQLVPDPATGNAGFDNIRFEVVGGASRGTLSTSSVSGTVTGASVDSHTVHGVANASFSPSTVQGPVQIKATVDRADGNVSNGITDPVSVTTTVVVSDGKLFSLVLTSPTTDAVAVNPVSSNIQAPTGPGGSVTVPPSPDGTYSLTVSAQANDRQGNPVPAGTVIEFGLVDAPMAGFPDQGAGRFLISGNDGDPQEGGKLFTAPGGHFRTAGGGAGPGDTLLVFGQQVAGNADLESARQVQSVNSETSLGVTYPFNPNDTSGVSVNSGAVLPYVIGRAVEGNIGATAKTDANGVARTTLNYPVSRIGKGALIWARGTGAAVNGMPRLITDISGGGFPGVAPGQLVVNQTPLPGNTMTTVQVCLYDALMAPIQGAGIGFGFTNLGLGSGSIDGVATGGTFAHPTGANGCTTGAFQTSGLSGSGGGSGGESPAVIFTAGSAVPALNVPISASGSLVLQASPSSMGGTGGAVTLLLTDANGHPVPGAQISGTCTAGAGSGMLSPTDANGKATTTITASLTGYKPANTSATCTFKTASGDASATVNLQGTDLCTADPENVACGGTPPASPVLSTTFDFSGGQEPPGNYVITSLPAGLACVAAAQGGLQVLAADKLSHRDDGDSDADSAEWFTFYWLDWQLRSSRQFVAAPSYGGDEWLINMHCNVPMNGRSCA